MENQKKQMLRSFSIFNLSFLLIGSFLAYAMSIIGCSSLPATYQIRSNPVESEVEILYKNGRKKNLGKTPLQIPSADIGENYETARITFTKKGYESQSVYLPSSLFSKSVEIDISLEEKKEIREGQKIEALVNNIAGKVADIQKLIHARQFQVAEEKVNQLIREYPDVPVFHSLSGNIYYLEKNLDKALASYRKALEKDPSSLELEKIVRKIEAIKGKNESQGGLL